MKNIADSHTKLDEQPKRSKSVSAVPSKRHKHEWVLLDKWSTEHKYKPLPPGKWVSRGGLFGGVTYIPGFDKITLYERLIDTINSGNEPYWTYQQWVCNCGETKTTSQRHAGVNELLGKVELPQQDTRSTQKPTKSKQKNAKDSHV